MRGLIQLMSTVASSCVGTCCYREQSRSMSVSDDA